MKEDFKLILVVVMMLLTTNVFSETTDSVHVETAGTLWKLISASDKYKITKLIVTGNLNDNDIYFLSDMAGSAHNSYCMVTATKGLLKDLDLSGVTMHSEWDWSGTSAVYGNYNNFTGYAFLQAVALERIVLPKNIECIAASAFYFCTNLETVVFSDKLKYINKEVFSGCSHLKDVVIPDSVVSLETACFSGCTSLENIKLGKSIKTIPSQCFSRCSNLEKIIIPDSVTLIESNAFQDCENLTSVTIGKNISTIFRYSFVGAPVTEIHLHTSTPPAYIYSTKELSINNCVVYIPKGSFKTYMRSDDWKQFKLVEEDVNTGINHIETAEPKIVARYNINGQKINAASHGLNILKMSNGTIKKVVIK
jgi:hypothetical protein